MQWVPGPGVLGAPAVEPGSVGDAVRGDGAGGGVIFLEQSL